MKTESEINLILDHYRKQKQEILNLLMEDKVQPRNTIDNWIGNLIDLNRKISELQWVLK